MVNCYPATLDCVFAALADSSRRQVIATLLRGERSLGDVAKPLGMSLAGVMKHVGVLQKAGLVSTQKRGRTRFCRLETAPLAEAQAWLKQTQDFWATGLNNLETYLQENP